MTVDSMRGKEDKEYSEMSKLFADEELKKIAEPILSYLKATLSIRTQNVNCNNSNYVYPWGFCQILLNCPEIKFSDLDSFFMRILPSYFQDFQVKETAIHYLTVPDHIQEKWIIASENSSLIRLLQYWVPKMTTPLKIKFPETMTILEAIRWYLCLRVLEQMKEYSPAIEIEKIISMAIGKGQIPKEFMNFEKMFLSENKKNIINRIQPIEGERMIYVLGKCTLERYFPPSDSNSFYYNGLYSVLLDPIVVTQLRKDITISAEDMVDSIILAYKQYEEGDSSNGLLRKRSLESLISLIGTDGNSAFISNNINVQVKNFLESERWIKNLPNDRTVLASGRTINEIKNVLSELDKELENQSHIWWNKVIKIKATKETSEGKKMLDEKSPIILHQPLIEPQAEVEIPKPLINENGHAKPIEQKHQASSTTKLTFPTATDEDEASYILGRGDFSKRFVLGMNDRKEYISLPWNGNESHISMFCGTGTGKSTLASSIVLQAAFQRIPVVIFDPKDGWGISLIKSIQEMRNSLDDQKHNTISERFELTRQSMCGFDFSQPQYFKINGVEYSIEYKIFTFDETVREKIIVVSTYKIPLTQLQA